MCMDACTNVSDGKSKKQNSEGRQIGPPSGGESKRSQRGWASLLFRARPRLDGIVALRMTSIHLWGENVYSVTKKKKKDRKCAAEKLVNLHTFQMYIHSLIWSSRRGTWNAAWRRSLYGCFHCQRGWWQSNPAKED